MHTRTHHLVRRCRRAVPGPLAWLFACALALAAVLLVASGFHWLARWRP